MPEVLIISGKGGTGKTSLTGAFAGLAENALLCDLDVDAPDLHLLLAPQVKESHDFHSGFEAEIDPELCEACGLCREKCRFDAVEEDGGVYRVNPLKCEGCKLCVELCPAGAINFNQKHCGTWQVSDTRFGPMVHAQLFPGEENSGRLVALLRQKAKELAKEGGIGLIISDGPPGIGCPVISSITGMDLAVIVTEPTPSGRHDLERAVELCRHFKLPVGVVINKHDLNQELSGAIADYCQREGLTLLAQIPFDQAVTQAMVRGKTINEFQENGTAAIVADAWKNIENLAREKAAQKS